MSCTDWDDLWREQKLESYVDAEISKLREELSLEFSMEMSRRMKSIADRIRSRAVEIDGAIVALGEGACSLSQLMEEIADEIEG
jgi:hypothetical protein